MKKPELLEMTDQVFKTLKKKFRTTYDESGTIGKRYRRQDEIGTPYCVTVDYDGVADGTVTVRERDGMTQKRIKVEELVGYIEEQMTNWKAE
jgi:glycyl-tRNA synthetase